MYINPDFAVDNSFYKIYYNIKMNIHRFTNIAIIRSLKTNPFHRYLFVLSVIGFISIILSTYEHGVVISHDSVSYIAAAKSLVSGNGFICYNGCLYVNWPPLYPSLLAIFSFFGAEPLEISRWLNAFIFAFLIFASGKLFELFIKNKIIAMIAAASILLSTPLFYIYRVALTESLFIFLAVLFIIGISYYLENAKISCLLCISIIAALCCLQRYMGITIVITGLILILTGLKKISYPERLKHASIFCLISLMPLFIWIMRNYIITSTLAGKRVPSEFTLSINLTYITDSLSCWFLPPQIPVSIRIAVLTAYTLIITALFIKAQFQNKNRTTSMLIKPYPAAVFVMIYSAALIISSIYFAYDPIGHRLLLPIYVFTILFIFWGVELIIDAIKYSALKYKLQLHNGIIAICMAFLLCSLILLTEKINVWIQREAKGYSSDIWQESSLMNMLDMLPENNSRIYSNAPMEIFIYTNRYAYMSPRFDKDIAKFRANISESKKNYLVWFKNSSYSSIHQLDELDEYLQLEKVADVEDGMIFRIKAR